MSARQRQGSASYTIVIAGILAVVVGGIVLTLVAFPLMTAFHDSPLFIFETTPGTRFGTILWGLWGFWPAIILLAVLAFIWIRTRQ